MKRDSMKQRYPTRGLRKIEPPRRFPDSKRFVTIKGYIRQFCTLNHLMHETNDGH